LAKTFSLEVILENKKKLISIKEPVLEFKLLKGLRKIRDKRTSIGSRVPEEIVLDIVQWILYDNNPHVYPEK